MMRHYGRRFGRISHFPWKNQKERSGEQGIIFTEEMILELNPEG
jgi:hypothetical protein